MPDDTREPAFPDENRNAMEERSGDGADDLARLFGGSPEGGGKAFPRPARSRTGRRALAITACLAVPLTACVCGAAFFLQEDPAPGYEAAGAPAPAPRVHRKPEAPAAKESAGAAAADAGRPAAQPGSLGENAKLMNELEAMRLRTRIAREEAEYLKAKQAADAVRNGTGTKPAESRPAAPAPARQDGKASRPAGRDVIISVQGAGNSLWALARTAEGRIVSLRPGSPFACGRVSAVTRQGVRVRCQNSTLFISF